MTTANVEDELITEMFQPEGLSSPHRIWEQLRRRCPVPHVRQLAIQKSGSYLITRKEDIEYVSSHPEIFKGEVDSSVVRWGNDLGPDLQPILQEGGYDLAHTIVTADPPKALHYRKIVLEALSPKKANAAKAGIVDIVARLISDMKGHEASVDFFQQFSVKLPMKVMMNIYGLPEEDEDYIFRATVDLVALFNPAEPIDRAQRYTRTLVEFQNYIATRVSRYRREPSDNFLSFIANAAAADGKLLTMEEVLSFAILTLLGGNETTRNALTSAAYILATRSALWEELRADAQKIPAFIEEIVRTSSPIAVSFRQAACDTILNGRHIQEGAPIYILWGSGSMDGEHFDQPDEIWLDRRNGKRHTSFGYGVHSCAGMHLARAELILAVESWLKNFRSMRLAVLAEHIRYAPHWNVRAIEYLPLELQWN